MCAKFYNLSIINGYYGVSIHNRTQSMSNYDDCFTFRCQLFRNLLNIFLRETIK